MVLLWKIWFTDNLHSRSWTESTSLCLDWNEFGAVVLFTTCNLVPLFLYLFTNTEMVGCRIELGPATRCIGWKNTASRRQNSTRNYLLDCVNRHITETRAVTSTESELASPAAHEEVGAK